MPVLADVCQGVQRFSPGTASASTDGAASNDRADARNARNVASTASVLAAIWRCSGVPLSTMDRSTCGGRMQKIECRWEVAHMSDSFVTIGIPIRSARGTEPIAFLL